MSTEEAAFARGVGFVGTCSEFVSIRRISIALLIAKLLGIY
jgi:hypothetical protein